MVRVDEVKDLGVLIDKKLTFKHHVHIVCNKAFKMLGFIKRCCKNFNSTETYLSLYRSLVRSNLEYCSVVWNPGCKVGTAQLERVQKSFIRF